MRSFTGALQIVLIVLKLVGVINWSWWIVLIPVWITVLLVVGLIVLAIIASSE